MRHPKYTKPALALALLAITAAAPAAASAATVTVRVEGQFSTLVPETTVTIGNGSGVAEHWNTNTPLGISCKDDTAAEALEQATQGNWDQQMFIEEIAGETLSWPESWTIYDTTSGGNPHYADWGACDLHLTTGAKLVFQAGENMNVANWRPYSPVLDKPVYPSGSGTTGSAFNVSLKKWVVPNTADTVDPAVSGHWLSPAMVQSNAASYQVTATKVGSPGTTFSATTNASGVAAITASTGGNYTFKANASTTGITGNWARSPATTGSFCVAGGSHTC